ncbi:uncharacterized protein LOC116848525 [Odontomachus brunneus]|uniref:uncharacterized protein LOC116848525 n=1 Tax=Odontomachus brunneus TaxID=486640 RepID=UPI0013F23B32|nr:uncharacterized protein LOC116848525 [Odontomachus brunneus]
MSHVPLKLKSNRYYRKDLHRHYYYPHHTATRNSPSSATRKSYIGRWSREKGGKCPYKKKVPVGANIRSCKAPGGSVSVATSAAQAGCTTVLSSRLLAVIVLIRRCVGEDAVTPWWWYRVYARGTRVHSLISRLSGGLWG